MFGRQTISNALYITDNFSWAATTWFIEMWVILQIEPDEVNIISAVHNSRSTINVSDTIIYSVLVFCSSVAPFSTGSCIPATLSSVSLEWSSTLLKFSVDLRMISLISDSRELSCCSSAMIVSMSSPFSSHSKLPSELRTYMNMYMNINEAMHNCHYKFLFSQSNALISTAYFEQDCTAMLETFTYPKQGFSKSQWVKGGS